MSTERKPFVVVEGGSGCGKTTAITGMKPHLEGWRFLWEPGGTEFGNLIREAVQQRPDLEIDPTAAFFAYTASRANLVNCEILPVLQGLKSGEGILLDRYWFSSYAYQSSEKIDKAIILEVSKIASKGLMPDLVLYYDLSPELAMMRKRRATDIDRYDMKALDFHTRVRDSYLELSIKYKDLWKIIDASKSKEEVIEDSLRVLSEFGIL